MRIPEGDETFFGYSESPPAVSHSRRPLCRSCEKTVLVDQELLLCLHCEGSQHASCYGKNPICPTCSLPSLRRSERDEQRRSWPCSKCRKNFTLVSGFSFCAACGATFHIDCRGFLGKCPSCKESAPVFVNAEKEFNLSPITRILRGRETMEDCYIGWLYLSLIVLTIYCFFGFLGLEIGYRALGIWGLGTVWWIYCAVLTRSRKWP